MPLKRLVRRRVPAKTSARQIKVSDMQPRKIGFDIGPAKTARDVRLERAALERNARPSTLRNRPRILERLVRNLEAAESHLRSIRW